MLFYLHHRCFTQWSDRSSASAAGSLFCYPRQLGFRYVPYLCCALEPTGINSLSSAVSVWDGMMYSAQMRWLVLFHKVLQIISGVTTGLAGVAQLQSQLVDLSGKACHVLLLLSALRELPGCWTFPELGALQTVQANHFQPKELSVSIGLKPLFRGLVFFCWVCCRHPCELAKAAVSLPLPSLLLLASGLKTRPTSKP